MANKIFSPVSDTANWSDPTAWGGSLPVTGDTITINTNKTCYLNVQNPFGDGGSCGGATINGTLMVPNSLDSGTYTFQMDGVVNHNITGTGQIVAGDVNNPLPQNIKFQIVLGAASSIVCSSGLKLLLYCSEPPHPYVQLTQNESSGATTLHINTDLSGETDYWYSGAPLVIVDSDVTTSIDVQGPGTNPRTVSSVGSNTLTINSGLDSQNNAGTYIFLATRNIEIQTNYSTSTIAVNGGSDHYLGCSIRSIASTLQGRPTLYITNSTLSGVISGFVWGPYGGVGNIMSGYGLMNTYGWYQGCGNTISGIIAGSTYGMAYCVGNILTDSGMIYGCSYGLGFCSDCHIAGSILKCVHGFYSTGAILHRGCLINSGSYDVNNSTGTSYCSIVGYGAVLSSINYYLGSTHPNVEHEQICLYDVADVDNIPQLGWVKLWCPGGRIVSSSSVPSNPPASLSYVHHMYGESASYAVWVDFPVYVTANKNLNVAFYIKLGTATWTSNPKIQIINPDYVYGDASAVLAETTITDTTDWQTVYVSYLSSSSRMLTIRVTGKDATKECDFAYAIQDVEQMSANIC